MTVPQTLPEVAQAGLVLPSGDKDTRPLTRFPVPLHLWGSASPPPSGGCTSGLRSGGVLRTVRSPHLADAAGGGALAVQQGLGHEHPELRSL